jgi:hypothetical protein
MSYGEDKLLNEREATMDGKRAQGGKEMRKHEMGGRLTHRQAILAKCYECANGYFDGKEDCAIPLCPLHPFMPYRAKD